MTRARFTYEEATGRIVATELPEWHGGGGGDSMNTLKGCPAKLAYRDMSDIGSRRICGRPAVTAAGFCRLHDPETKPKRDARGRIVRKEA